VELMCRRRKLLSELIDDRIHKFPASGEINRVLDDPQQAMTRVEMIYTPECLGIDRTDGLSMEFADWRFNLRSSNTEPVLRLNVEARGDEALMKKKTSELLALLDSEYSIKGG